MPHCRHYYIVRVEINLRPSGRDGRDNGNYLPNPNESERNLEQGMSSGVSKPLCTICKNSSHSSSECWLYGKPSCQTCKKFGHIQNSCWFNKKEQANFSKEKRGRNFVILMY